MGPNLVIIPQVLRGCHSYAGYRTSLVCSFAGYSFSCYNPMIFNFSNIFILVDFIQCVSSLIIIFFTFDRVFRTMKRGGPRKNISAAENG